MNKDRIILIASLIFFCLVTVVVYWYAPDITAHFEGDSVRYDMIARNVTFLPDIPLEVLGYPLFLSSFYCLFNNSIGVIVFIQFLLSISCLFLLRSITFRLGDEPARNWVTILWGCNLGFLIYTQLLLIEIILTVWLLLFVERIVVYYFENRITALIQAALVLGISILFRPAALFYALFFTLFLLCMRKKKSVSPSLVFLGVFYSPILLYMSLNFVVFGRFMLCPVMNVNLFLIYYPKIVSAFKEIGIPYNSMMERIEGDIAAETVSLGTQVALFKLMLSYPFITIKIWIINMIKSFIGLYVTQWKLYVELGDHATSFFAFAGTWLQKMQAYISSGTDRTWLHILGWFEVGYLIVEYVGAFIGFFVLLFKRYTWLWFFAFSFVMYFAFITGPDGSGRFRMMIEPWLLILAALGLALFTSVKKKKVV